MYVYVCAYVCIYISIMYVLCMYDVCIYAFMHLKCKADLPQVLQGVLAIAVIP